MYSIIITDWSAQVYELYSLSLLIGVPRYINCTLLSLLIGVLRYINSTILSLLIGVPRYIKLLYYHY